MLYPACVHLLQGVVEEEEDLVITLEGISTSSLAQLTGRFYRWLGKKLPLGADVRAIQVKQRVCMEARRGGHASERTPRKGMREVHRAREKHPNWKA